MITFQDFKKETNIGISIQTAIREHKASTEYRIADAADKYYHHENPTIMHAIKVVYNLLGQSVPNIYAANNHIASRYYAYFVDQEVQYLLANGATFTQETTKPRLGINFDTQLQRAARYAINGGTSFGFFNLDHIDIFPLTEFVPLYDEESGYLRAGIRFWQLTDKKPTRATLYEEDGLSEWIDRRDGRGFVPMSEKRAYILITRETPAEGTISVEGLNYPGFPVVPFYNTDRRSALSGGARNKIDAYDLVASQMVNNIDEGNLIYWVLKNCGGMDLVDDERFVEQLRMTHVAHADADDGGGIEAHKIEAPIDGNIQSLDELRGELFDDFMALNIKDIAAGATTATQIRAAYEPLNTKADLFEYEVINFVQGLLRLIGIEDTPTFKRSTIVNQMEETQMVMMAAPYLDDQTLIEKLPFLTPEEVEKVLDRRAEEGAAQFGVADGQSAQADGFGAEQTGEADSDGLQ